MGFFSKLKPETKAAGAKRTSSAVQARIKNILGLKSLVPLPANAMQAFQLSSDPQAAITDFVRIISADEALGARVLRVANSVYFSRGQPAADIEAAVANIGLEELRCLLSATLIKSLLKGQETFRKQLWANAVATAVFSKGLARQTPSITSGEAFLAGLVHDLGKLLMTKETGDLYQKVNTLVSSGEVSFIEAEEKVFELNHVEVGKWAAEHWNFPRLTVQAIAEHHQAWPTDKKSINIGTLVSMADMLAHAEGIGHPKGMNGMRQQAKNKTPQIWALLNINELQGAQFIKEGMRQFDESISLYENV